MTSYHYTHDRKQRERKIQKIGEGSIYAEFLVDHGHINGAEKHVITTTGIIIIYNAVTLVLITKIIARPAQIKRYFPDGNFPEEIVEHAKLNQKRG